MSCPMFDHSQEIKDIIQELLDKREDIFGELKKHFWIEMVKCGLRVDKSAPGKQKWTLKIKGVRGPDTLLNQDIKYIIHGYKSTWDSCSPERKIAHVANMLIRIEYPTEDELQDLAEKGEDYEMGKLRKPDIEDFRSFLIAPGFGLDWASEGKILPDLLVDKTITI